MKSSELNMGVCQNCGPVELVINELSKQPMDGCRSCGDQLLYLSDVVIESVLINED